MNDLSQIPSVDQILNAKQGLSLVEEYGHQATVDAVRTCLDRVRSDFLEKGTEVPDLSELLLLIADLLGERLRPTLVPVINASGVIIHTNLGRAPLSKSALEAVSDISGGYSTLEFSLETGGRGSRLIHAESQFKQLLGAEAAAGHLGGNGPLTIFLAAVPLNFYAIIAVTLVLISCLFDWNIGPMKEAERRAREEGKVLRDGATPVVDEEVIAIAAKYGVEPKMRNMPAGSISVSSRKSILTWSPIPWKATV